MVSVENYVSISGVGDLLDYPFTSDTCYIHVAISFREGQGDNITSIEIDSVATSFTAFHTDGTLTLQMFTVPISTGSHTIHIMTSSGILKYGLSINCVHGWETRYTAQEITSSGTGTTISVPAEIRSADGVLSYIVADTNVVATSADTLLATGTVGSGADRIRYASSFVNDGTINWSLATSQEYIIYAILFRGTTLHTATPTHIASPTHQAAPSHIGTPGHIILNP